MFNTHLFKQYPKCHIQSSHAFKLCSIHTSSNNTPNATFNPPMPSNCVKYTPLQTIPQTPHSILPCLQPVLNTHLFKQYPKCHIQSSHAFNLCSIHTSSNNTPANDFFSLQPFCFIWWTTCTSPTKVIPLKRPRFSSHGRLRTLSLSTFYCLQPGCSG